MRRGSELPRTTPLLARMHDRVESTSHNGFTSVEMDAKAADYESLTDASGFLLHQDTLQMR